MSQVYVANGFLQLPQYINHGATGQASTILNATGETLFMVGHVWLENPLSGAKTISAAGGGSIVWRSGSVTFSNGSTVFDVGIQDVSTATAPAQGDGTFDVYASFTGGGGGVTSGGVLTFSGFPRSDTSADATGTAAAARIRTSSGGTDIITGLTVGTSGADINLDSVSITSGQTVTISSATITHA